MELRKLGETGNQTGQSKQTKIKKINQSSGLKAKDQFSTQHVTV